MTKRDTQVLTQQEFTPADFEQAALGYRQTAYTSTSALWGLFCLAERIPSTAEARAGAAASSAQKNWGCCFVQDVEDLGVER